MAKTRPEFRARDGFSQIFCGDWGNKWSHFSNLSCALYVRKHILAFRRGVKWAKLLQPLLVKLTNFLRKKKVYRLLVFQWRVVAVKEELIGFQIVAPLQIVLALHQGENLSSGSGHRDQC